MITSQSPLVGARRTVTYLNAYILYDEYYDEYMFSFDTHFCKLRTMSGELHNQGIDVILDMVFNHSAEGALGWVSTGFIWNILEQSALQQGHLDCDPPSQIHRACRRD